MFLRFLKGKIHRATVTDANLEYEGSISIDPVLMEASGILPYEKVEIYNVTNGERFATYAIPGTSGTICINGAAAWKAKPNHCIIIACYCFLDEKEVPAFKPRLVYVDSRNGLKEVLRETPI